MLNNSPPDSVILHRTLINDIKIPHLYDVIDDGLVHSCDLSPPE